MARGAGHDSGLDVVRCIRCPQLQGDYIAVDDCRKCPFFLAEAGRQVRCGYTFKTIDAEPSKQKEYTTKW